MSAVLPEGAEVLSYRNERKGWAAGPWDDEPDVVLWVHCGLQCAAMRGIYTGALCGYVAVPPGHALHGVGYRAIDGLVVHGQLTSAGRFEPSVGGRKGSVVPEEVLASLPAVDWWWIGFDAAHTFDFCPRLDALSKEDGMPHPGDWGVGDPTDYKTLDYVIAETNGLAEQIARRGFEVVRRAS